MTRLGLPRRLKLRSLGLGADLPNAGGGGGDYVGPFDIVSAGALAGFSVRALSSASRGSALFTIRRDSDDTEQSFSSDAVTGAVSVADVETFIDGGSGFCSVWNEQSIRSDASQATASKQPSWVSDAINSLPGFGFDFSAFQQLATSGNVTFADSKCTTFAVIQIFDASRNSVIWGENVTSGTPGYIICRFIPSGGGKYELDAYNDGTSDEVTYRGVPVTTGSVILFDAAFEFGACSMLQDGAALTVTNIGSSGNTGPQSFPLGVGAANPNAGIGKVMNGQIVELLIYDGVLAAPDRTSIRQNIAAYYGITLP